MLIEEALSKYDVDTVIVGKLKKANKISSDTSGFIFDQDLPAWTDHLCVEILESIDPDIAITVLSSKDFISTSEMGDKVLERIVKQC